MNEREVLKEKIAGLKFAKDNIKDASVGVGICSGLTRAHLHGLISYQSMGEIKIYINKALNGHAWLNDWIQDECGLRERPYSDSHKMRNTRQAWIDWMIQCYQEDLDKLQSPEMTMFYNDIQKWIDNGCPRNAGFGFKKSAGLCENINKWADKKGYNRGALYRELKMQFENAYLDTNMPFSEWGVFNWEQDKCILYKNTNRLNWIKAHC